MVSPVISQLGIPDAEERFERYRRISFKVFLLNSIFWCGQILFVVSVMVGMKYFDFVLIAFFALTITVYLYGAYLSHKLAKMADKWLLKSSKVDLFAILLPLVVGLLVTGTIAFWFIKEIAGWPVHIFLIFPLIFSLPLMMIFFLFFGEDRFTAIRALSVEPENVANYLNSKLNGCQLKRNPWLGGWRAKCQGVIIGVYVNSTCGPMKSRVVVDNIRRENLDAARG